jgi:glycerate 2-kinase
VQATADRLARDGRRDLLLNIYRAALVAVDGRRRVRAALAGRAGAEPVWVVAIGKAASAMTLGALDALGPAIVRALVVSRPGHFDPDLQRIPALECIAAGHPLPDAGSLAAGEAVRRLAAGAGPDQQVLVLVSGGASALIEALPPGIALADLRRVSEWGLASGVDIVTLNAMRRSLSLVKDGRLASWFAHCRLRGLAVSDVPGDDPAVIGSGLLRGSPAPDRGFWPAWLQQLAALNTAPPALEEVAEAEVVACLDDALAAAERAAATAGLSVLRHARRIDGNAVEMARDITLELAVGRVSLHVWGGEPTVTLPPHPGRGGRAQHLALAAARWLAGHDDLLLLAAGTDGSDGNSEDAGALVDGGTVDRGAADGLDPDDCLRRADAGTFLEDSGDLLYTGPTGTNVGDIVLALRMSGNRVRDLLE